MAMEHFDAVVVGSGFGGSVMTYRLAEAGLRVCLLERGKAYPPGAFPRSPHGLKQNFWDPSAGLYGMFSFWSFPETAALVSAALGGGSLIYANVLIRKDEKWFTDQKADGSYVPWVVDRKTLDPHYDVVEKQMNVQRYPFHRSPFSRTGKTEAMREAAAKLGLEWQLLPLAVSFRQHPVTDWRNPDDDANPPAFGAPLHEPDGPNLFHAHRSTCRLCGECDVGCNYGAKNTLDYTYLSAAARLPAPPDIRTLCEVKSFDRGSDNRFHIRYVRHAEGRTSHDAVPEQITANRLILAAGTFGTTYLMLKNRAAFPGLSAQLGRRYSGNGDLLSFILRAKGPDGNFRNVDPTFGPVITSAIRVGDALDGGGASGRGFYIEDGGFPAFLAWLVETASDIPDDLRRTIEFGTRLLMARMGLDPNPDLAAALSRLIGDCATSNSSFPVLAMGRDNASGTMSLRGKYLSCDWKREDSEELYRRIVDTGERIAAALGARYQDNPAAEYFNQVITAHPLGGCPMGASRDTGVVNEWGEVFGEPNLYVADGSVLPGPVGPNPALTIAALANRFADHIVDTRRRS
jgi:cholesterol oxidase